MKKGVSMITLAITIGVIVILTSIIILNVSDTNMINQATDTVNKYNEVQNYIYDVVKNTQEELDEISGQKKTVIFNGRLEGTDGTIMLPILLNDTSKQYILDVSSTLYTGQILVNVYGIEGGFIGAAGVNAMNSYVIEIRHLILNPGSVDGATLEEVFGTSEMAPIYYESDGNDAGIFYYSTMLGSELTITKITQVDRSYTLFTKTITQLMNLQPFSVYNMKEATLFCVNSGTLGYNYLREMNSSFANLNEAFEMNTLQSIINTRVKDLNDLETCITDQVCFLTLNAYTLTSEITGPTDIYTFLNYLEENAWLNEWYYRLIGNTIVPFTVLYSDVILTDLNEDGVLGGGTYAANYNYAQFLPTGNAGIGLRGMADAYSIMGPIMLKYDNDMSQMPIMEQAYFEEMSYHIYGQNGSGSLFGAGMLWQYAQQIYNDTSMDTMYSLMYNKGLTIGIPGLKMGWNSIISEYIQLSLADFIGVRILPSYDIRMDSDAINRQGVRGIINELYAYTSEVQEAIRTEFSMEETEE